MKRRKPWWAIIYAIVLVAFTSYVLLDTFVIPRTYEVVDNKTKSDGSVVPTATPQKAQVNDNSYSDGNVTINISTQRENATDIYVADIVLSDSGYLKTAFANNSYGRNVKEKTSEMAENNNAILAINGDFYGARNEGYVIRNGVIYRDSVLSDDQQDLVIYEDGSMEVIKEGDISAKELLEKQAYQVFTFGPGLITDGNICVGANDEVDQASNSNPRTAIGIIDKNHYVFVVADGRTSESAGLSLYQLAQFMDGLGVTTAYNLDGGGSSTMVFNGNIVNNPVDHGSTTSERRVSDIVYIG